MCPLRLNIAINASCQSAAGRSPPGTACERTASRTYTDTVAAGPTILQLVSQGVFRRETLHEVEALVFQPRVRRTQFLPSPSPACQHSPESIDIVWKINNVIK